MVGSSSVLTLVGQELLQEPESGASQVSFRSAKAIWPEGRDREMNLFVGFRADFQAPPSERVFLCLAGATLYRAYVNGQFAGWGPARGPHGYYRVDRWDITPYLHHAGNVVSVEVAGYNINSYWTLNQPSFLQAEVVTEGDVLAATGSRTNPFTAHILGERIQKVQRYSFQRAFSEAYKCDQQSNSWRLCSKSLCAQSVVCATQPARNLISRAVPYPTFRRRQPEELTATGTFRPRVNVGAFVKDRSLTQIGPELLGFPESELTVIPFLELQRMETVLLKQIARPYSRDRSMHLRAGEFSIVDLGSDMGGFLGMHVEVASMTRLHVTFDETLTEGDVDFKRLGCVNIVAYMLQPGKYDLEAFEPYTLRFLKFMVLGGECRVKGVYLREYAAPETAGADFTSSDEALNRIFAAGKATYSPNAVDLFTDCPSRERAGWLCDSYFTAQAGSVLSGNTQVERAFLENFQLAEHFEHLPAGMLPMCYPADHYDGQFIPNWALWFVLQLEDFQERGGDRALVGALRSRVLQLLQYLQGFQNENGLLEKLKAWVFVEWSRANDYTQDVNYPTNMLYARALAAAGKMYGLPQLTRQSQVLHEDIRKQSFDGEFFVDNAVRSEGRLKPTRNRTETCQYYAFFCGTATRDRYPALWQMLLGKFGPGRNDVMTFPEVARSEAFIGNVLRMELLSNAGLTAQWINESRAYLLYMAERTGTLWENMKPVGSLNHAVQSHVVKTLHQNVLGLYAADSAEKKVTVRFTDSQIEWCEGKMPTTDGPVSLRWKRTKECILYAVNVPTGYTTEVINSGAMKISPWQADESRRGLNPVRQCTEPEESQSPRIKGEPGTRMGGDIHRNRS